MEFSGSQTITAPIGKVWAFLVDVNNVAACAPGFQSMEELGEEHWKAIVAVGLGAVKAKFTMDVIRPEQQEPEHMLIKARGKAPGSAVDMTGDMHLESVDDQHTRMDWKATAVVSGTIAAVGARLLSGAVERLTEQFFDCLKAKLEVPDAVSG
jgi:uncharacterized protein